MHTCMWLGCRCRCTCCRQLFKAAVAWRASLSSTLTNSNSDKHPLTAGPHKRQECDGCRVNSQLLRNTCDHMLPRSSVNIRMETTASSYVLVPSARMRRQAASDAFHKAKGS